MKAAVQLTIGFDEEHAAGRWVTTAMCRGLLPEIAGVFRTDDGHLHLTDIRHGHGQQLPIARPTTGAALETQDQRAAMAWLVLCLLTEDDSLLALEQSDVDPDSIQLDGTDITYRDTSGLQFRIQVLPVGQS